ncbi:MAG TPA: hypothetical protein PK867_12760, partial [Pirellulales bacterium]|nr:hypothetical protein [Pirellulales bacterium]
MNSESRPGAERFDANDTAGGAGALWQKLGLPDTDFLDPSRAPEVDEELLRRLVRQELPESAESQISS